MKKVGPTFGPYFRPKSNLRVQRIFGGRMEQTPEHFTNSQENLATGIVLLPFEKEIIDEGRKVYIEKREFGRSCYKLGKTYYDKSDLDEAEVNFSKALQCGVFPKDTFVLFKTLGFLIRIASEKLEDDKALTYIERAETMADDYAKEAGGLNAEYFYNLGLVKNYRGDFMAARENFQLSFKKSKEENEAELQAKTLLALATNSFQLKEFERSLEYLHHLDQLLRIISKDYLRGSMYLYSGRIYTELGLFDKALAAYDQASYFLQKKKCWNLWPYVLLGRGVVYKRMGQFDKSLTFFNLAHESADKDVFKRLVKLVEAEIEDVNDSSVDIYLDKTNRKVHERELGVIDFKHRFVLLEILFLLAKNCGTYYDKDKLAKAIWKDEYNPLIHDKLIYTSVSRLRKLIEPKNSKGEKRKYIIRGKDGYTFNPHVKIRFHMGQKMPSDQSIGNVDLGSPV